jgi:hypothetical protein
MLIHALALSAVGSRNFFLLAKNPEDGASLVRNYGFRAMAAWSSGTVSTCHRGLELGRDIESHQGIPTLRW